MEKVSPRNVMKINEVDQSSILNSETYLHYYNRLILLCTSLFKWENLPNNIPERFIEKTLFSYGQLAFLNDENLGVIVTKCTQFDQLNLYDEPVGWNCFSNNGYWENYRTDEIEVVRNNKYSIPTKYLIEHHLQRLYDIERTIDSNLWQQRNLAVLKSNENSRLTLQNIMKNYDGHGYMIYGNDKLDLKDNLEVLNFNIPFIGIELEDLKERKWNDLLNMLGINTANTNKRERLISDEANANNQLIELDSDVMLAEREIAVERINKRYGLDIKVSLRKKIDSDSIESEVKENE